jgi:hypothetical protein
LQKCPENREKRPKGGKWEKKEKKSRATPQVQTLNDRFP